MPNPQDWKKDLKDAAAILNARGSNDKLLETYDKHKEAAVKAKQQAEEKLAKAKRNKEKKEAALAKAKKRSAKFVGPLPLGKEAPVVEHAKEQLAAASSRLNAAQASAAALAPAAAIQSQFETELGSSDRSEKHLKAMRKKFAQRIAKAHDISDEEKAGLLSLIQVATAPSPTATAGNGLAAPFVRTDTDWLPTPGPTITYSGHSIDDDEAAINAHDIALLVDNAVPGEEVNIGELTYHPNKE